MSKKSKRQFGSAREDAERRGSGANYGYIKIPKDVKMFTPENECVVTLDIIPYEITDPDHMSKKDTGTIWYRKPFKVHRYIGAQKDTYVCPTTFGKPCPICDYREELREDDAEKNKKTIDRLKPSLRNLYIVKIRDYEGSKAKFDKKIFHLFDFSDYLFQEVFESQLKKKDEFDNFFHPEEGTSLEITFDEDTFEKNKYPKVTRVDFVKRKKQYDDSIIDEAPNLDEVLTVLDYDDLEAKLHGDLQSSEKEEKKGKKDKKGKKEKEEKPDKSEKKKKDKEPVKEEKSDKKDKKSKKEKDEDPEPKKKDGKTSDKDTNSGSSKKDKKDKKDKKEKGDYSCPHGHKFAKDVNKFEECDDCKLWAECKAAKKAAKKG